MAFEEATADAAMHYASTSRSRKGSYVRSRIQNHKCTANYLHEGLPRYPMVRITGDSSTVSCNLFIERRGLVSRVVRMVWKGYLDEAKNESL